MKPLKQLITIASVVLSFTSCSSNGSYTITEAKPQANNDIEATELGNSLLGKKIEITWYEKTAKIEINGHRQVALYKQPDDTYTGKSAGNLGTDEYTLRVINKLTTISEVQIDIESHTEPSMLSTMGTPYYTTSDRFTLFAKRE
jgi:hypothetical protein